MVRDQDSTGLRIRTLERKPRSASRGTERKMLGITWRDRKGASWIRKQTKVEDILVTIKKEKRAWPGYVMRRVTTGGQPKKQWQPRDCRRGQGRQRTR